MRAVNHVILGGNLGKDPEIKYLPDGTKVATFSLALSQKFKGKDGGPSKERTDWISVVSYAALAEICEKYLSGGDGVVLHGRITTREWDDQRKGVRHKIMEIVANEISFISLKKKEEKPAETAVDDDVPF